MKAIKVHKFYCDFMCILRIVIVFKTDNPLFIFIGADPYGRLMSDLIYMCVL